MRGFSLYFKKRESKCVEKNIINHNKDYYNSCSNKCPLFGDREKFIFKLDSIYYII